MSDYPRGTSRDSEFGPNDRPLTPEERDRLRASSKKLVWPATGEELKAAGYQSIGGRACTSCGTKIIFAKTPNGGTMPLELVADEDPEVRRYQAHFVSCLAAHVHRRKRPGSAPTLPGQEEG